MMTGKQAAWIGIGALALAGWRYRNWIIRASEERQAPSLDARENSEISASTPGLIREEAEQEAPHLDIPQNYASSPES